MPSSAPNTDALKALMISHIDNAGISRVKIIPRDRIPSAERNGATVSLSLGMLLAIDDHATSTDAIDPTIGDLRGLPDMSALALLDEELGLGWAPSYLHGMDGNAHPTCQRSFLRQVSNDAKTAGFDFLVGMELEFTLYRGSKDDPTLAHDGPGYGTLPFLELEAWHLDLLNALETAGVPVEQLHPEYERGQIELSFAPRPPVRAVDDYVLARMIVTRTAIKHGLLVSFAPVPELGGVSNGCHIHLSATRDGSNVFYNPSSTQAPAPEGALMIAGILEHLVQSLVLLGGSTLSFERLKPHNWAGAYACWGPSNREAAVRYMPGFAGNGARQANIEVKCADPAANHYLAVGTLIGAAMYGVSTRPRIPKAVLTDPAELTDRERRDASVERFPENLGEALARYKSSSFLKSLLGPMLFHSYEAVRQHDWDTYGASPASEVAAAVRWRY